MEKTPLISVIIPVYNVQDYVAECLDSIINQSYQNLEIIVVNDGSKDNSALICKEYALKDTRILFLEKENGGLSSARNFGLDHATGDFISFIDSDDFIDHHYFEILFKNLDDNDFIFCDATYYTTGSPVLSSYLNKSNKVKSISFTSLELLKAFNNFKRPLVIVSWGKLFKKEIWEDLRYPHGKYHEDEATVHHFIDKSKKIKYIDLPLYYYRQDRCGSITNSINYTKINDYYQACLEREEFFLKKGMINEANEVYNNGKSYLIRKRMRFNIDNDQITIASILSDKKLFLSTKLELIFKFLFGKKQKQA
ncbi:glycosyltransferase [Myroides marinus]|uniref:glycosyltransferase family 2 protein n=1 Tax=Myroides marinus TaxID=703342 RepID=UPI0025772D8A|nr:glycosyltransferase family 2 protein [Myroides marinus]MDM1346165.1 glycosyltransferase [Myroides marinus]MDM1351152.1 glycosyltransferase [Myroides marinus]MDM1353419.1 glycosyltransferase [Myroides marinus]MDM1358332.1 glycosyltransferase [Myroides marinus]MDM1362741.1 glycosyltransferase [Myroides marinus]